MSNVHIFCNHHDAPSGMVYSPVMCDFVCPLCDRQSGLSNDENRRLAEAWTWGTEIPVKARLVSDKPSNQT